MKKLFLIFMLLTPLAIADERAEIFISPSYGSYRGQKKNDFNQEVKNVIGSGVKISFERRQPFIDDSGAGIGAGIVYNALKVKGNGIKSSSGSLISVPLYMTLGTGLDNGIYTKVLFGLAFSNGNVKWTDKNGGHGEIKAAPINGYGGIGIGVQKDKFSVGISAVTAPRLKRSYSSPTKKYRDKISDGLISLEFGYNLNSNKQK